VIIYKKSLLLQQINSICRSIDTFTDKEKICSTVADVIHTELGYDHVALYLVDYQNNTIILSSIAGIYKGLVPLNQRLKMNQGIVGFVVQNRKTVLSNDVTTNHHFLNITPDIIPTKSELCVPVSIKDKIIGVINIESTEVMEFSEDDLNSLEVLANRIGVAIHNSRLYSEMEKKTQQLYDIVSSMGQAIVLINDTCHVEWVNATYVKWMKGSKSILGEKCYRIFGNDSYCDECEILNVFQTGKIYRNKIVTEKKIHYSIVCAPVRDELGDIKNVLLVFDDVTQNANLRKSLENTKKRLDKRKNLAVQEELTSRIAHEIRNPLNAISTSVGVLQDKLKIDGDDERLLNIVAEEADRLNIIISDYLDYSGTSKLKFEYHDLCKTIKEVVLLCNSDESANRAIKIELCFDDDIPKLKYDRDSIKQVLWNIIINALQSIATKGLIKIVLQRKINLVIISIMDNGRGIGKKHLQSIFKKSYSSKRKGSGLGLSIVKRIIDQHEWVIKVDSELNVGTCFTIEAPIDD